MILLFFLNTSAEESILRALSPTFIKIYFESQKDKNCVLFWPGIEFNVLYSYYFMQILLMGRKA